jgi:transketolase
MINGGENQINRRTLIDKESRTLLTKRILEIISHAGRGHIGPALSILDIVDVLYGNVMNNPQDLNDINRDRFILSKGHGCLALYVVLEKYGLIGNEELETFCTFDSAFGGHPENFRLPHIEFSTGALGHGASLGIGLAVGSKLLKRSSRVYVLLGDGEMNEGSIWEAAMHAHKHKLNNLCFIVDKNRMQASGSVKEVLDMEPIREKWEAFGLLVRDVDGHNREDLVAELNFRTSDSELARVILASTIKGKGLREAENSATWHHKAKISNTDIEKLQAGLY